MEQQTLSLKHWGLERWPFAGSPGVGQFYPTAGHNEALARIEYLVNGRRRMGALLGDSGVGKSLLLRVAAAQLGRQRRTVVLVDALGATTREVLWQTASGLGTLPREDADTPWLWRQIADRVAENRVQEIDTVLFVDGAGQAGPDLVAQFARLARLDTTPSARWTIVLAAEPAQTAQWNQTLRNLVDLRIEVGPWSVEDTIGYVQTALVEAGRIEPLFEDAALAALHELSGGVPRQVTRLADYSLLAGAAADLDGISAAIVEAAYEEIAWPAPATVY
jgi:type II secretory pathway predicted ATPase ExeA